MSAIAQKTVEQIESSNYVLVDVRSPAEYQEYHLPHAVNLPIFNDEERAEIGTIYKQQGMHKAKERGLALVSPKLNQIYEEFQRLAQAQSEIVVYCWRGGMRSKSVATIMNTLGISCYQLQGGIRSYRKQIMEGLAHFPYEQKQWIVISGNTGTKKTEVLKHLAKEGFPILDLERLANHRGSLFGQIGLQTRSQKEFEALLWQQLKQLKESSYIIVEAESKRLGRISIPEQIMEAKSKGCYIHLTSSLENRVEYINRLYQPEKHHQEIIAAVASLKKRLVPQTLEQVLQALENKEYKQALEIVIQEYYDPRYEYAIKNYPQPLYQVNIDNWQEGLEKIRTYLRQFS